MPGMESESDSRHPRLERLKRLLAASMLAWSLGLLMLLFSDRTPSGLAGQLLAFGPLVLLFTYLYVARVLMAKEEERRSVFVRWVVAVAGIIIMFASVVWGRTN